MRTGLAQGFAEHVMSGGGRPSQTRFRARSRNREKREQQRRNARDTNHRFVDFTPDESRRFMIESIHPFDATRSHLQA